MAVGLPNGLADGCSSPRSDKLTPHIVLGGTNVTLTMCAAAAVLALPGLGGCTTSCISIFNAGHAPEHWGFDPTGLRADPGYPAIVRQSHYTKCIILGNKLMEFGCLRSSGPMMQACTLVFTPVTGPNGEPLVQEERACTVSLMDPNASSVSPSAASTSATSSTASTVSVGTTRRSQKP